MTRAHEPQLRIEDYAVVGDTHTMALVGSNGSIDWLCLPSFDSPACFAALLGNEDNGRWQICPAGLAEGVVRRTTRSYREGTLVLETEWETATGVARLTDAMPPRDAHVDLIRRVEVLHGEMDLAQRLTLRFNYGSATPWIRRDEDVDGSPILLAVCGPDAAVLRGTHLPKPDDRSGHPSHHGHFRLTEGERAEFSLVWFPSTGKLVHAHQVERGLAETEQFWRQWSDQSTYTGSYQEAVQRSLITLKALTFRPTGGIAAAPTTSLPEQLGGPRNWDYRYCWLRDATLVLAALLSAGYTTEAAEWRQWLERAVAGSPDELQIVYGLRGERMLFEFELPWLPGYEGSAPVRIGNGAAGQFQLDVYGELISALCTAAEAGLTDDGPAWDLQVAVLEHLEQVLDEPDSGLWEVRGPRRHFTHSRVMVWVAFDRAVRTARSLGLPGPIDHWAQLRDRVHAEVCEQGWNDEVGAFTQYYGGTELDASLLMVPLVGFLPPDDPRVAGTIDAVDKHLRHGPLVDRYQTKEEVDGLPPGEGSFLACSFWLVSALAMSGRLDEATALFEELLSLRNDVGLLAEEYDGNAKRMTGNFPQAFSHLALVEAAVTLERSREGGSGPQAGARVPLANKGGGSRP